VINLVDINSKILCYQQFQQLKLYVN